jgi:hypothetical protein
LLIFPVAFIPVLQITGIAAAIDATKEPGIAARYNIRGYPTVKYFKAGQFAFDVNVRDASKITEFMRNPHEPPPPPAPETAWSEEASEVVHLTDETFKTFLKKKKHVLVMFYAPCKYSKENCCLLGLPYHKACEGERRHDILQCACIGLHYQLSCKPFLAFCMRQYCFCSLIKTASKPFRFHFYWL